MSILERKIRVKQQERFWNTCESNITEIIVAYKKKVCFLLKSVYRI